MHRSRLLLLAAGMDFRMRNEDRRVLRTIIHPDVGAHGDVQEILAIGADWDSRGYRDQFKIGHDRVLEPNAAAPAPCDGWPAASAAPHRD